MSGLDKAGFEGEAGYYFVFSHGRDVTDLPFEEVVALIKKVTGKAPTDVQNNLHGMAVHLCGALGPTELETIVSLAGYVLFAGHIRLMRPWEEVSEGDLRESIEASRGEGESLNLLALTHEGFPEQWPHDAPGNLMTRFWRDKFYLGKDSVAGVFQRMKNRSNPWNASPPVFLYDGVGETSRGPRRDDSARSRRTVILFQDLHEVTDEPPQRSDGLSPYPGEKDQHVLIVLDGTISSRDLVHLFDDRKPFWPERHTTPPRLAAAAINLLSLKTSHHQEGASQTVLLDPFVGTGTVILEALKYPGIRVEGRDRENSEDIDFNLRFFLSIGSPQIEVMIRAVERLLLDGRKSLLRRLCEIISDLDSGEQDGGMIDLRRLGRVLSNPKEKLSPSMSTTTARQVSVALEELRPYLRREGLSEGAGEDTFRFLLYFFYRAAKDNPTHVTDDQGHLDVGLVREALRVLWGERGSGGMRAMLEEASRIAALRADGGCEGWPRIEQRLLQRVALYSPWGDDPTARYNLGVPYDLLNQESWERIPDFDHLVTDLPYAFNTPVDDVEDLYRAFVDLVGAKGKPGSEMVLITLDKVKSGQSVPEVCYAQSICKRIADAGSYELTGDWFWKSRKALNRRITRWRRRSA